MTALVFGGLEALKIGEQNKALEKQGRQVVGAALTNYARQQLQQEQIKKKAGLDLSQRERVSHRQQASTRVAAVERGISGNVRELSNIYMQESFDKAGIISQQEAAITTSGYESLATATQQRSQLSQLEGQQSGGLESILRIGGASMQGYATGKSFI